MKRIPVRPLLPAILLIASLATAQMRPANRDGKSIGGIGSSQGGALSIVTTALAASHPALSDATSSLYGRAGGWPDIFKDPSYRTPANLETEAYSPTTRSPRRRPWRWSFRPATR